MCDESHIDLNYHILTLDQLQKMQFECVFNPQISTSHYDDYKSAAQDLMRSGVKKGHHSYETVYLISNANQFDLLRKYVRIGFADITRFESYTKVNRYPNVSGYFHGKGWYKPTPIELDRYDEHERRTYDYDIRLVVPVVEEVDW